MVLIGFIPSLFRTMQRKAGTWCSTDHYDSQTKSVLTRDDIKLTRADGQHTITQSHPPYPETTSTLQSNFNPSTHKSHSPARPPYSAAITSPGSAPKQPRIAHVDVRQLINDSEPHNGDRAKLEDCAGVLG